MSINIFKLEQYLATYEFSAPYLLCCSDAESFSMAEIISLADEAKKKSWNELRLGYTEVRGLPALREQIATSLYPTMKADNILCFAGAEEGIFCTLYALIESTDHVIVFTPCYQSLLEIPKLKRATVSELQLKEENEWRIDIDEIKKSIRSNTKCIIINFPHNPTGQVITKKELSELIALCDAHNIWLFSDEVYHLLGNPKEGWAPPAVEIYTKGISVGVMSKAFGMAGLRVGWIASHDAELLKKAEYMKHYTSICNSAPSEILTLIALSRKEYILQRNNQIVQKNLILLDPFFKEYNNLFEWVHPQGGCVGFVQYKGNETVDTFCDALVKQTGVLLMPASIYNFQSNHFRIGFGRNNMPECLDKLKTFINTKI